MHGCGSGSALLVNAEVDSMGGVVDGGVGIGIKTSPRRAAIEKAQAELRQEYDVREERRRELEFLEKGGNPLDFKFGNAASVSVQSTSLTDHHPEHFVTSEAKGSFPLTASPHGDSVESSGRPGAPKVREPNSADNFDGENELLDGERKTKHSSRRSNITPSEQSSQMDGAQNAKESEDSAIFRPYARRNRSRPNRDGARSSSNDVVHSSGGHGSSFPVRGGSRDAKGSVSETNSHKDQMVPASSKRKLATSNGDMVSQFDISNSQSNMEVDGAKPVEVIENLPVDKPDVTESGMLKDNQDVQPSETDIQKTPVNVVSMEGNRFAEEQVISASEVCPPTAVTVKNENDTGSALHNGFSELKRDGNETQNGNAAIGAKGLDSESSCTQNSLTIDVNNDSDLYINRRNDDSNGILMPTISKVDEVQNFVTCEKENEKNETRAADCSANIDDDHGSANQNSSGNGSIVKVGEQIKGSSGLQNELKCPLNIETLEQSEHTASEVDRKPGEVLGGDPDLKRQNICPGGSQVSVQELPESTLSKKNLPAASEVQSCSGIRLKLADKAYEDSILEEARTIEAKRKRIAELSVGTVLSESHRKSHWDIVLEEMAWLANDFAQERIWKITAAAQICRRASLSSQLRVEEQNQHVKLKKVAYTLAKAVMQFWHSAEVLLNGHDQNASLKNCKLESSRFDEDEFSQGKCGQFDKEPCKELDPQNPEKNLANAIREYAVRFLKCNSSTVPFIQAEAPITPDRTADSGIMDVSWDDRLTEESLFYAVPSGAMETYRASIESHLAQCEKIRNCMQEEVDTSMYDTAAEFGYHENAYDEEEGETSTYYSHGVFDGTKSTKHDRKKQKNLMKSYSGRTYELGAELPYGSFTVGSQQNILIGKRPANNLNVCPIPTKRMRTASRQRVISPFSAGNTGVVQAQVKNDASSGDTSSFQDDQSTLHGGSQMQRSMEVESVVDFEKQLPYDCAETSTKPKKKKKKHLGSAYEQGWQLDSTVHNELRDVSKRRLEGNHFDSNGTSGLYGQHAAKKPKMMKQLLDNTYDNMAPMSGSIPSPAASHMSNMSNTNRLIKLIGGRERGRKNKSLKTSAGQPGSGSPWSLFEDQALVVLVHDMGPNWELVSDAMNSTLQFKCIFRKPKECRERHKVLMDKSAGDGADSAEDSGSSQSYPSTLPGIPKGSARQLFQRLQGPMEEDTLKSHFEKIIAIGKKLHYRRAQNDNQDPKQITAIHNSHVIALSQVCPNNLSGSFLTPLDLCDATTSSPDALALGYQGSHSSGLTMPNQGTGPSMLPTSGANSPLQGSSGMVLGNNSSPSGSLNAPSRDSKYSVPRTSLPVDEQQRMQHYNQMLSSRNMQQANVSGSGSLAGPERGVRMLPGGNGVGMVPGMNRNVPLSRPGFQGMTTPPSMLNSGSMLSSSMVGMPSPVNIHAGTGSGQGNSMMRPRESLHMMRPGHNPEHQRQMVVPELQMQVTQGNSQGIAGFNGMSSAFANQTTPPAGQTYPGHPQQQHQISQQSHMLGNPHHPLQGPNHTTSQQAYAIRLAKERQMQQRILQQQQQHQQFAASGALMPHAQHQPQLPISSPMQNSSQIQPPASSQPVSMPPLTPSSPMAPVALQQQQQKHNLPHHGLSRNPQTGASGLTNQMGKQRQRQPPQQQFQQTGRHHPQQRQHSQSPQQAKLLKGMGRGNMVVHQNLPMDHSHLNGISVPPGNQGTEKGDQMMHLMQGQGLYSGAALGPIQPSKPLVPPQSSNHTQPQQKLYSSSTNPSAKPAQQTSSHSDNSSQGQALPLPSGHTLSATHQAVPAAVMASNHQHLSSHPPPHQKQVSQAQATVQRAVHQNRQVNPDVSIKSSVDQGVDQQSLNSVSQKSTSTVTAMPQSSNDSGNVAPVVSSATVTHWKPSESSIYDSGMSNQISQRSPATSSSAGSEPVASVSQGLGQRQLSGGLSQHGHNAGSQWQQLAQVQQSTQPAPSQQPFQPQEQQSQQEQPSEQQSQSQQQRQQLQPAQGGIYIRPTTSNLE